LDFIQHAPKHYPCQGSLSRPERLKTRHSASTAPGKPVILLNDAMLIKLGIMLKLMGLLRKGCLQSCHVCLSVKNQQRWLARRRRDKDIATG
jgi:hypothetical protein